MKKHILLLSFFYPPDLSAGSFRAAALVRALQEQDAALQIDVLTTQPNRYAEHDLLGVSVEQQAGVKIQRIRLPKLRKGFVGQAVSFWRYARKCITLTSEQEYDLVVATSSRLMTALLGAWLAWRKGARLYLDLRDIFTENLSLLFPRLLAVPLVGFFGFLERWAIGRAHQVNLVSKGFLGYFQPRYPKLSFSLFPNGVDEAFVSFAHRVEVHAVREEGPLQVLYAGNLGDGQGLHTILPTLAQRLAGRVHFKIVGSGGRAAQLRQVLAEAEVNNVELLKPVPRAQLLSLYEQADVLFLHLNDYPAFRRVLPSKLFEYAATGKPIWAGVEGYCADFMQAEVSNIGLFSSGDVEQAIAALSELSLQPVTRADFVRRYARKTIMQQMAQEIVDSL